MCARTRTGSAPRHDVAVVGYLGGSEASRNLAAAVCMSLPLEGLFQPIGNTPRNTSAASGPFVLQRSAATKKSGAMQRSAVHPRFSLGESFLRAVDQYRVQQCASDTAYRAAYARQGRGSRVESGHSILRSTCNKVQHAACSMRCSMPHAASSINPATSSAAKSA